ncbi:kelch repeat-containing protein [Candidatus Bathycorpusculum sp.]|uniref:kelch repeat-containing protein n=1 Tax=Candidatus Bathycorpusculum sp. TaxID=2994959 RepID=UPI00281EFC6A|nr:hypothetical protein [Candidatus Termitimicrobium sp.]MCL2685521.1 hypothetical protein [Candidatus Termitimicrobium sp.]
MSPPEENVWVEMASMRYPRSYFGTVVADGKIYAIGGLVSRGVGLVTGAVERYDPQTNTWMTLPSLPTPRYGGVAVCSMGKIYYIGGSTTSSGLYGVNEVYDPATNQWTRKASIPTPRNGASACVVDGYIYVMGGYVNSELCEVYDPIEDTWSVYEGPWPEVPSDGVVFDGREYVCDGVGLRIHDLVLDSWMDGANVPLGLHGRGVVEVDGLLYVLGGCTETYSFPNALPYELREYFSKNFEMFRHIATTEQVHFQRVFMYTPFGYGRIAPEISVLSLEEGGRYDLETVTLEYSLNHPVVWMGYCLDGQANVTVGGNVSLSGLSSGRHSVRVFAEDKYGNTGASETITFTVANAPRSLVFIGVVTATTVVVAAVVVCLGLSFLRKNRHKKST